MSRRLHLDTNALIALSDPFHPLFLQIEKCLEQGWAAETDAVAWHEYVRGPLLPEDIQRALLIVENRVFDLTRPMAEKAAELFNVTGRRRASTADCLIAAVCIGHGAELLTNNIGDFTPFKIHGLKIRKAEG